MPEALEHLAADDPVPNDARRRLPRGVWLMHNETQEGWLLLALERIFKTGAISVEILTRCTGEVALSVIADEPAKTFNAPRARIHADVSKLLGGLADKKPLEFSCGAS